MAKSENEKLRKAFLENSSQYLAVSSPSTSAHLMTERLALTIDDERTSAKTLRNKACNACGTLMILGWNAITRRSPQKTSATSRKRARRDRRDFLQACKVCHRETVAALHVEAGATKTAQPKRKVSISTTQAFETRLNGSKSAEKTSSKQRAKTRRDKGGLQALLNKSKQQTPASFSTLDWMDLMKA